MPSRTPVVTGHPLVAALLADLRHGPSGLAIAADALHRATEAGQQLTRGAELFELVRDLLLLSEFLREQGAVSAASTVLDAVAEPLILRLQAIAAADIEARQRAEQLERMVRAQRKSLDSQLRPEAGLQRPQGGGAGLRKKR